ncbi:hypothetical protein LBMAG33_3440 [Candidatus Levyibacteriota bacterium]|nr:hypothetical protein [Candidatus Levybacteria bacterium]GDX62034.1 hypothetical protein LBMAG33_3440 [Candidatus Levybacteria bacterium]
MQYLAYLINKKIQKKELSIITVLDAEEGFDVANKIIKHIVTKKTLLLLSGGQTPRELYIEIANQGIICPGAVGLIDERYGAISHKNSNELMLENTGLIKYFDSINIPFYSILKKKSLIDSNLVDNSNLFINDNKLSLGRTSAAIEYDNRLRSLFADFSKSIGILGIGADGHTAGIAGNRKDFKNPLFEKEIMNNIVSDFNDKLGIFGERISMTFLGLSMLDFLFVLVFGKAKQNALSKMFAHGSLEDVPSRFFLRPEISQKTLLITDQTI